MLMLLLSEPALLSALRMDMTKEQISPSCQCYGPPSGATIRQYLRIRVRLVVAMSGSISGRLRNIFSAIPGSYLKIEGNWIPYVENWAIMIPMVEMAQHPVYIGQKLYFSEPTRKKDPVTRSMGEDLIGQITVKTALNKFDCATNGGRV
jgi:hypothetical protein